MRSHAAKAAVAREEEGGNVLEFPAKLLKFDYIQFHENPHFNTLNNNLKSKNTEISSVIIHFSKKNILIKIKVHFI